MDDNELTRMDLRLHPKIKQKIQAAVEANYDKYESSSHFVRVACINELKKIRAWKK